MDRQKKKYEKPILAKEKTMNFPIKIVISGKKIVCRQCSACHGCRSSNKRDGSLAISFFYKLFTTINKKTFRLPKNYKKRFLRLPSIKINV